MSDVTPLDLSGANMKGFDPVDPGTYQCVVEKVTPIQVEKDDGKLPQGTPGYNVQFNITEGPDAGQKLFNRFYLPVDPEYTENPDNATALKNMRGFFARFLVAIGYEEKTVTSGKFKFDREDALGRPCEIVAGQTKDKLYNTVRSIRPISDRNLEEAGIL